MLKSMYLQKTFWVEAIDCVVHRLKMSNEECQVQGTAENAEQPDPKCQPLVGVWVHVWVYHICACFKPVEIEAG